MGGTAQVTEHSRGEQFDTDLLKPSAELHHFLTTWRERLDPASIPGLNARGRKPRKVVSQDLMAALVGVSAPWYGKLERGDLGPDYSPDFLDRVAYALRLNPDERRMLYLLAVGREPAPLDEVARTSVSPTMKRIVHEQRWPTWISDRSWDVLVHNEVTEKWLPHFAYERNIMRWLWAYPESQYQLVDYRQVWAPLMLAQMRAANAKWPGTPRLQELITEAMEVSALFRHLWENDPMVYHHPDGDRRWMFLPFRQEPVEVEIRALMPMGEEDLRLVCLVPTTDDPAVLASLQAPPRA
ncbi:hypothetical protein [Catellatospora sp. NPDC049133]|uniref:helix-turn-helix domain-containing protein n=1 Tax=Catellatospora sp. NPDC049133 TaxID=3155499 RepID=UPI0034051E1D